ncbi:hypothetical protein Godav_024039, partial [Gossypium davidsonii]|nr:hypothetical protein [Gossypium davidsonii]MBA0665163.1 hypothetical protein [Gossypium klotzschianum]
DNWVYLSTDRAVAKDFGYVATAGVARDRDGNWIGYTRIIIMTDNLEVAQILSDMDLEDLGITMIRRTHRILQSEEEWKIKHIPRNQNLVVDRLAKLSLSWKLSLQVIDEAPKNILDLLQVDKMN